MRLAFIASQSIRQVGECRLATSASLVNLEFRDLASKKDLQDKIEEAYGPNGLGILTVSGVETFTEKRKNLLPLAQRVATLPDDAKKSLEAPEAFYGFGWSHGKEKFNGKFDYMKGSYYANPQYDFPTTDKELIKKFPSYFTPNIWPNEHLPELEHAFKSLGQLIVQIGLLVAYQCDNYISSICNDYEKGRLVRVIGSSHVCKARLLHYFPPDTTGANTENQANGEDPAWCGWHCDHGSLTGLTPAMYTDQDLNDVESPDPQAGLYIRTRSSEIVKALIQPDRIAFQIGESSQIHSGGFLQSTPHCVVAPKPALSQGIARNTFAVFMQPEWNEPMNFPSGTDIKNINVPQWRQGQNFAEFTEATIANIY